MCAVILVILFVFCLTSIFTTGLLIRFFTETDHGIYYLFDLFKTYAFWLIIVWFSIICVATLIKMKLDLALQIMDIKRKNKTIKDIDILNQNISKISSIIIFNIFTVTF